MDGLRSGTRWVLAILVAPLVMGPAARAIAQEKAASPAPHKSVYGTLQSVDKILNGVIMKSEAGERLAWRFEPAVIAEAAKFKLGDPMIVIYRQTSSNEKRVTAVAFPGTATTPLYVNMTGSRVVLRSGPMLDGACGGTGAGPVTESTVPIGGMAEVNEACWCCAAAGESCTPGNQSGLGRALLVRCFE